MAITKGLEALPGHAPPADADVPAKLASGVVRGAAVKTSELETRTFRAITLPNGLHALLVSDMLSDLGAAAVDVSVGNFSDPPNLPGLAHFCEHMLFLGTKKYDDEASFRSFLAQNSGMSNAYTSAENTNYHFQLQVQPDDLTAASPRFLEALDRFAQFFQAPLFTESATGREMCAVDSEHQKNLQRDNVRFFQLQKSRANPAHPYSNFNTGSLATLGTDAVAAGVDVRQALLDFHTKYYSANLMNVCVHAPYSLDVLEKWTVDLFSSVPNNSAPSPADAYAKVPVLLPNQHACFTRAEPIADLRSLDVYWLVPVPDDLYLSKPDAYICHILGHEGKGSLLSLLKARGWVDSLCAYAVNEVNEIGFLRVVVNLTESGADAVDEIVETVFGCIELIRKEGVAQWIHDEIEKQWNLGFRFAERGNPFGFVQTTAAYMQRYPPQHYLTGPALSPNFDPDAVRKLLGLLTPERVNVLQVGQFEEGKLPSREKWYGTRFGEESIAPETLARWSKATPDPALAIPPENIFMPTDFAMLADPLPADERDWEGPSLIESNAHYTLHHKLDRSFNRPRVSVYMELCTTASYRSPRHAMLAKLFAKLVIDELTEYAYDIELAGVYYDIVNTHTGLRLVAGGYSDKIGLVVRTILQRIAGFRADKERFATVLDAVVRENRNFAKEQPYSHCVYAMTYLLEQPRWHLDDYLSELTTGELTPAAVDEFVPELLSRLHIVALVAGNASAEWSRELMKDTVSTLKFAPHPRNQLPVRRISRLPAGVDVLHRMQHRNPTDNNSAVRLLFELGQRGGQKDGYKRDVAVELLAEILNPPVFHELRTVQQLGYMVFEGLTRHDETQGIYIIVQSAVCGPDGLLRRIRKCLGEIRKGLLEEMTDEAFQAYVTSLRVAKLEKETKMFDQMNRYWVEIYLGGRVFDRRRREAEALLHVTKQDVLKIFDECIAEAGGERKCLVTMAYGNQHPMPDAGTCPNEVEENVGKEKDGEAKEEAVVDEGKAANGGDGKETNGDQEKEQRVNGDKAPVEKNAVPVVHIDDLSAFRNALELYPAVGPTVI